MAPSASRASVTTTAAVHDRRNDDAMNNSTRQTRTNPSRVSKTAARSLSLYGQPNTATEDQPLAPVPHGFYPALTHFTDAITALPREFRRHNSLLKEVDAKAWALEENLNKLLQAALDSEPVPCPPNPAPIIDGVIRDYPGCQVSKALILLVRLPVNCMISHNARTGIRAKQSSPAFVRPYPAHALRFDAYSGREEPCH